MHVAITGAAGRVGSAIRDDLRVDHEITLIDCKQVNEQPSITVDLGTHGSQNETSRLVHSLRGVEVLVHLAEDPNPHASWQRVLNNNIGGTWKITRLAAESGVRRVVYASSHWAVRALEEELAPTYRMSDGRKIHEDVPPSPNTYYGIAKVCGELTGRMLVDSGDLESFIAVRIGNFEPNPVPNAHHRTFGILIGDLRRLFRRCVEADFSGFHTVYGISAQESGPFDLSRAKTLLDWEPSELPT